MQINTVIGATEILVDHNMVILESYRISVNVGSNMELSCEVNLHMPSVRLDDNIG